MQETTGVNKEDMAEMQWESVRKLRKQLGEKKTLGKRFTVPRDGDSLAGGKKEGVDTILYYPSESCVSSAEGLPVLLNMHGGAWVGGDAVVMESFCQMMADEAGLMVVNVNYQKADVKAFPYAIEEVADTVCYFIEHAQEYRIDPERIAVGGHSAGGQLACGAAIMLKERGVKLAAQMLVYPCTDMAADLGGLLEMIHPLLFPKKNGKEYGPKHRWASPLHAEDEVLKGLAPAIFVFCGPDILKPMGIGYAKRLIDVGVPVKTREFPKAEHGFLEVNRPDYIMEDERKNPEQAQYCRECEKYLADELKTTLNAK